jgi:hypothetical protein
MKQMESEVGSGDEIAPAALKSHFEIEVQLD